MQAQAAHSLASSSCGASSSWRQSRQGRVGATDESGPLASGLVAPRAGVVSASTNPSMEGTMEVQNPPSSVECDSHYGRYWALRRRLGHMGRTRTRRLGPRPELEAEPGRRARHVHMMRVCVGTRTSASGPPAPVLAVGCRLALSIPSPPAHAAITWAAPVMGPTLQRAGCVSTVQTRLAQLRGRSRGTRHRGSSLHT